MGLVDPPYKRLDKKMRRGVRGHPIATIAFYGPTNELASKVVVSIVPGPDQPATVLKRWFSEGPDIRYDEAIGAMILALLQERGARSVVMTRGVIGCPHEEGVDYPLGEVCPRCPFWKDRDRWKEA
ncbi:MAG TPA: hypothetical protein VGA78_00730 [Gemmatimonadales bacterium]